MNETTSLEAFLENVLGDLASNTAVNAPREVGELLAHHVCAALRAAARAGIRTYQRRDGKTTIDYDPAFRAALTVFRKGAGL